MTPRTHLDYLADMLEAMHKVDQFIDRMTLETFIPLQAHSLIIPT